MKDGMCVNSYQKDIQEEFEQPQTWRSDFSIKPLDENTIKKETNKNQKNRNTDILSNGEVSI